MVGRGGNSPPAGEAWGRRTDPDPEGEPTEGSQHLATGDRDCAAPFLPLRTDFPPLLAEQPVQFPAEGRFGPQLSFRDN